MQNNLPPHPLGWACSSCRAWRDQKIEMYMTPQGGVPANPMTAKQVPIGTPKVKMGLCQNGPQWVPATPDNYCWQFKPRFEVVESEKLEPGVTGQMLTNFFAGKGE